MTLLIVTTNDPPALLAGQTLAAALQADGLPVVGCTPCHMLVREVVRLAPLGVIVSAGRWDEALQAALDLLASSAPRPVLVVGATEWPADPGQFLRCHVMAWLPGPVESARLAAAWCVARAHFDQTQTLKAGVAAAEARLDERKWVDRAKGVLMHHQQLSEVEAFALLRTASMHANLRVGEVSRGLIEAARAAEAVNRAGQVRMQSQRFVKGLVLRGMPRPRPDDHLADTTLRLQANLDHLASLALVEPLAAQLASTQAAWTALQACAGGDAALRPADAAARAHPLDEAERLAEILLEQADRLTAALDCASGRRNLQVINLCGRQRMLSQRLAKQALLAGVLPDPAAARQTAAAAVTVQDFEAALLALELAPLASEGIRAALAQARGQWHRLLDGQRRVGTGDAVAGRAALARESDALSSSFDQLTSLYEHSMQVLMG